MTATVIPRLAVHRVASLPDADAAPGRFLRTPSGLFYSDGVEWHTIVAYSPPAAPVNTVAPVVSGSTTTGGTLSCTTGTWTGYPSPTFSYQWELDDAPISGATDSTYETEAAGSYTCVVTATNSEGSDDAESNTVEVEDAPTIEIVQSTKGSSSDAGSITLTLNGVQAGSSLILVELYTTSPSPHATTGNISGMTAVSSAESANACVISGYGMYPHIFHEHNVSAGNKSVTITLPGEDYSTAFLLEVRGLANAVPDKTATGGSGSGTAVASGSTGNTTQANNLVLAVCGMAANNTDTTFTTPAGYTRVQSHPDSQFASAGAVDAKITDAIASHSAAWTANRSAQWTTVVAVFKGAA